MATILTRQDLDEAWDDTPPSGEQYMGMVPRCHPHSGLVLRYDKDTSLLSAECKYCGGFMASFAIAERH